MPTPLPTDDVNLQPPAADEVVATARGVLGAVAGEGSLTEVQRSVLSAHFAAMTGVAVDVRHLEPAGPDELGRTLARRNAAFRSRIVQVMLLAAFVVTPLPPSTAARIGDYVRELSVDDSMIPVAQRMADGALGLVVADFNRAGYHVGPDVALAEVLHVDGPAPEGWTAVEDDPELAERWEQLGDLAAGTLGRRVWEFYRARGFEFPGRPGSAPPLLAQHDWIHVLADYGSTVEAEIEVFGLISRANDDPRGFSLLAMVLGLFETGLVRTGAGLFSYDPRHLSADAARMATRLADALYRGALVGAHFGGRDLLTVDWFALADQPVPEVRDRLGLPPKAAAAVEAGSVGPWQPGGISEYQLGAGRAAAERRREPYDSYGAALAPA